VKTAVIVLADGFEEIEAITPVDLLRRAGVQVVVAALTGLTVVGARGVKVVCDLTLENLPSGGDALLLPGGLPGAQHLADSPLVRRAVSETLGHGGWVAAICAAPALVLGTHGFLRGRAFTCYPGMEDPAFGGQYRTDAVVVDGTLVTSRGVATAGAFGLKLVELLAGAQKASEVSRAVLWS